MTILEKEELKKENEKKKKYLWQYEGAVSKMEYHERRIKELRLNKMCPSIIVDGMPHGNEKSDLSTYAFMLEEEEEKYMRARYNRVKKKQEIEKYINNLHDKKQIRIMIYRYICLYKWEKIAERTEETVRNLHKIHGKALTNLPRIY